MTGSSGQLDDEGFMRLVFENEREVLRCVMAVVPDRADARDVVQESLIALWKKRAQYDPAFPFVPWACRFALNEIRMHRRRESRRRWIQDDQLIEVLFARREELAPQLDARPSPELASLVAGYVSGQIEPGQMDELTRLLRDCAERISHQPPAQGSARDRHCRPPGPTGPGIPPVARRRQPRQQLLRAFRSGPRQGSQGRASPGQRSLPAVGLRKPPSTGSCRSLIGTARRSRDERVVVRSPGSQLEVWDRTLVMTVPARAGAVLEMVE